MSMPAALQRRRDYAGPALFSYGFRPFFLGAGLWASLAILLWLPQYMGYCTLPTHFGPLEWHVHEMLFGFAAATIAGFLLTAIPNWTGRLPVNGLSLAALVALWVAGRCAILFSAWIGGAVAAAIDTSFLFVLALVAAREIVTGKNWRNLRVLILLTLLIASNVTFHVEVLTTGAVDYGIRLAIAAVILLISLIGGRIVPSFTGNWIARENPGRRPAPFSRYDMATMLASAIALVAWIVAPAHAVTGGLLLLAGILQSARLARWAGDRTTGERLVLILHVAYVFVPLGFLLIGASVFVAALPASAGIHAWTAGAMGLMTLAVMTRASLGHTGHALHAGTATEAVYAIVFVSAVLRIVAALIGSQPLLDVSGLLWIGGFGLFALSYGPILLKRKPELAKAGC
jgi:uncharacterized protein involved in response to NO